MHLAIVINDHLDESSAHSLYTLRLATGLARARPSAHVHLIYPKSNLGNRKLSLTPPANLHLHGLLSLRRAKRSPGLTLNFIYYHRTLACLKRLRPDIIYASSYPKLWQFLLQRRSQLKKNYHFVYELHELAQLKKDLPRDKFHQELDMLEATDQLIATTQPLAQKMAQWGLKASHLPLACAFHPADFPAARLPQADNFQLGYIGSVYFEQGIQWLASRWQPHWGQFHIIGGQVKNPPPGVHCHRRTSMAEIKEKFLPRLDALVIPSLPVGRMPYVAITKSYDYLAMHRPIIAADLPSISEVLQHQKEALLFRPADIKSFEEALLKLKQNPELAQTMVKNAEILAKELNWEKRSERFWQLVTQD